MIRQIRAITRSETAQLFFSPEAWLVIVLFCFQVYSNFTSNILSIANDQELYGSADNITQTLFSGIRGLFPSVLSYLFLYMPIVTMGLMSKELNSGSIKLLYSSPVTPYQIILGKFRAMAIFSGILIAVMLPGIIFAGIKVENLDFGLVLSGLCGIYLILCTYSAIGLFMSSLTSYQIVAALLTLGTLSFLEKLGTLGQSVEFLRQATYWASISGRAEQLIDGLISSEDLIYFLLAIMLFLSFSIFLLQYRRDKKKLMCAAKYIGSTLVVLLLGVLSAKPALTVYYDATRNDDNTITDASRKIVESIEGPLTITTYVNLSDYDGWLGAPSSISDDIKRYKKYMRFKPDIDMKYVYYYDEPYNNSDYGTDDRIPTLEMAVNFAEGFGIPFRKVLRPEEIRDIIDLRPEKNTIVKLLESSDGKSTFLRVFDDFVRIPEEQEISTALRRLTEPPVTIGFTSGSGERSIYRISDEAYSGFTTHRAGRDALVNQGFDVSVIDPASADTAGKLDILAISDPSTPIDKNVGEYIFRHLDGGGNMLITIDPGNIGNIAGILKYIDMRALPGQVRDEDSEYAPELIPTISSFYGMDLSYLLFPGLTVTMPDVTAVDYIMSEEWEAVPLLLTPDGSRSLGMAISREINGKEQRIILLGDADCLSNLEMNIQRKGLTAFNAFFANGMFNWLSDGRYPVDIRRPAPIDINIALTPEQAEIRAILFKWGLTGLLLAAGCLIVIRRMRR